MRDHAALAEATKISPSVIVVFVFDTVILDPLTDRADRRVTFIHESLLQVDAELRKHGSRLLVLIGDPVQEIPRVAAVLNAEKVVCARDADPYAMQRDSAVRDALLRIGVQFESVKDVTVFEGGEIMSDDNRPYRVYSPYARAWRKRFAVESDACEFTPDLTKLAPTSVVSPHTCDWTLETIGFKKSVLWLEPGESGAQQRLAATKTKLSAYKDRRDFPAEDGTSGMSVHLRFGTVSVRECVRLAIDEGSLGADKWLAELIWREFYHDILHHHPRVVETTFQPQYAKMAYPGNPTDFEAWCAGQTGYPLIDAAMRCLNSTGAMHNRLRMIVASFLTKDLLIDYRLGEEYFAKKLLDFELASNNGGWQWAASVGCDPQPYFRIFNPILQSLKFDPKGDFIRRWVPELSELSDAHIHFPANLSAIERLTQGVDLGNNYPTPIVDHSVQRELAISLLASYKTSG